MMMNVAGITGIGFPQAGQRRRYKFKASAKGVNITNLLKANILANINALNMIGTLSLSTCLYMS